LWSKPGVDQSLANGLHSAQPSHLDAPRRRTAYHPVKPFAARQDNRPPSTPSQRLKPTQSWRSPPPETAVVREPERTSDDFVPVLGHTAGSRVWRSALASRRRRDPPRQTGQDRRTQPTLPPGPPGPTEASTSQPALIKSRISTAKGSISTAAAVDDDLHYKTGPKSPPNWVEITTLAVAGVSLIGTVALGILTYRADEKYKDIVNGLNQVKTSVAEFQASGTINYRYVVQDIRTLCEGPDTSNPFWSEDNQSVDIEHGFVQNAVWQEVKRITDRSCNLIGPNPALQNLTGEAKKAAEAAEIETKMWLAYLVISKDASTSFNPRVELETKQVGISGSVPIWDYKDKPGVVGTVKLVPSCIS